MPEEPKNKRAVAFFDGQNLFHSAKTAFGCTFPNYDPAKLAVAVCEAGGWALQQTRFYTGVPCADDSPHCSLFWSRKLLAMSRARPWHCSFGALFRRLDMPEGPQQGQVV